MALGATNTLDWHLGLVVALTMALCVPSCQSSAAATPVVLWVSNPVGPNQTALVWGDSFESVHAVVVNTTSAHVLAGGSAQV